MADTDARPYRSMDTTTLGPLSVSRIALGTMFFGTVTPADESQRMLDRYLAAGGNLLDTADVYGDGESERTLAPWLAHHRDEVVVATKLRWRGGLAPHPVRPACDARPQPPRGDLIHPYPVPSPDP